MANPVTPDGKDTLPYSACQNCDWRGPTGDTRDIKNLHERVEPGEPMPSGECPECGALCQPLDARLEYLRGELRAERISMGELAELQGLAEHIEPGDVELLEAAGVPEHTVPVRVTSDCTADVREIWLGDAPAHLDGSELLDWAGEQLRTGDGLAFDSQDVSGEYNREVFDVEVLPADAPDDAAYSCPTCGEADPSLCECESWLVSGVYADVVDTPQAYETTVAARNAEEAERMAQAQCIEDNLGHKPGPDDEWAESAYKLTDVFARRPALDNASLAAEIKDALEGDSNDAEHDALVSVASHFGIEWTSPYEKEDE